MTSSLFSGGRGRASVASLALVATVLLPGLTQLPAIADPAASNGTAAVPPRADRVVTIGDSPLVKPNLDTRGIVQPTAQQRRAADLLGADVRWNDSGTPASLSPRTGSLGRATSENPVTAARSWLVANSAVLGITRAQAADLELVNNQRFADSPARAVLFQQRYGDLAPALDGLVTVGVANGQIAYVSSSLARTSAVPAEPTLSAVEAFRRAAADVGRPVPAADVADIEQVTRLGWTRLSVPGFNEEQMVRLRALADADGTVHPAYVVNVLDNTPELLGYTLAVDAVDGRILHRHNQVLNHNETVPVDGETTATECGPMHEFEIPDNASKSISFIASYAVAGNDIVLKLFGPDGENLATVDVGLSPEVLTYTSASIPSGTYAVQVCPLAESINPVFLPPGNYAGAVVISDQPIPQANTPLPRWRYTPGVPTANPSTKFVPKNFVIGCFRLDAGCDTPPGALDNPATVGPWDVDPISGLPTFTTTGNNAVTREAWLNPLAPGGAGQAPISSTREYTPRFTDAWQNSRCNPDNLVPGGNDINASVANLFVAHNRMHDYSYYLGFTEENYNLQTSNQGRNTDPSRENDPELGQSQAGALTAPAGQGGRNNANQRTLQDGVPGITNQYLFQPQAGIFYAPCTDGGFDMGIVGHEYTHAISNRMIAGPDGGILSDQGGAMGESWGDLIGGEYMFAHDYYNGDNVWAVGSYATGNRESAIRNYSINENPLNYSNVGYDSPGAQVHADGEIWSGINWEIRQALIKKWNKRYPASNDRLQQKCAQGGPAQSPLPVNRCPGNRRWVQLVFDAFLLQQSETSMLDARDAMLAADRMRFGGANQKAMWDAFARRGIGKEAATPSADSEKVKPSFASPKSPNGTVTFRTNGVGRIFVGKFEARVSKVADTRRKTKMDNKVPMTAGTYRMLFASERNGFTRFRVTVRPGQDKTVRIGDRRNLAATRSGATLIKATPGSRNPLFLLDGTENTNWGGVTAANVDKSKPFVSVDLRGGVQTIRRVQVSAMLNPPPAEDDPVPVIANPDSGSRFTALRRFAVDACVRACGSDKARWKRFYTSRANAFPAVFPRPTSPKLNLRSFRVPATRAAALRFVVLENQCTGAPAYRGELDSDPLNPTDCASESDRGTIVNTAEFQAFAR